MLGTHLSQPLVFSPVTEPRGVPAWAQITQQIGVESERTRDSCASLGIPSTAREGLYPSHICTQAEVSQAQVEIQLLLQRPKVSKALSSGLCQTIPRPVTGCSSAQTPQTSPSTSISEGTEVVASLKHPFTPPSSSSSCKLESQLPC